MPNKDYKDIKQILESFARLHGYPDLAKYIMMYSPKDEELSKALGADIYPYKLC